MTKNNNKSTKVADTSDIAQTLGIDHSSTRSGRIIKWAIVAVIIIIVGGTLLSWFGGGNSQTIQYKTDEAIRDDLVATVTATGTLEPVNQVDVGSEVSGTVEKVAVDFNDEIKQGQVLATLNTDQFQARVNQARAAVQLAQAQVKQTEATVIETKNKWARAKELAESGMCSKEDCDVARAAYDRAEANLLSAKAQVVEAQASLDAQQTTLSKATIHSPINGIVLKRDVEPGQTVAASLQTPVLFTLAEDLTKMELQIHVDEADVGQVKVGQQAQFTVDAYPDRIFPAVIIEVHFASQTVEGVVTYETVLRVDNSELLLRPGMTATADITVKKIKSALLVTNAALRFTPPTANKKSSKSSGSLLSQLMPHPPRAGSSQEKENGKSKQRQVWVLRDEQPVAIPVRIGVTDGVKTEILDGDLEPGMEIIVESISLAH